MAKGHELAVHRSQFHRAFQMHFMLALLSVANRASNVYTKEILQPLEHSIINGKSLNSIHKSNIIRKFV